MPKSTILLLLATCNALFGQNPSFDYASYAQVDFDSLIKATPKAKLEASPKADGFKGHPFDVFAPMKIRFVCTLASAPMEIDIASEFGSAKNNPYMNSLKTLGVKDPPSITTALQVKTKRGKTFAIVMQDVLKEALLHEGRENGKIEIYGLHYMNDADGPVIVMSGFKMKPNR
jgi:hypothetical protein